MLKNLICQNLRAHSRALILKTISLSIFFCSLAFVLTEIHSFLIRTVIFVYFSICFRFQLVILNVFIAFGRLHLISAYFFFFFDYKNIKI